MVRLVFRPYTQIGRSICTSESLRSSTRVSSGFDLPRHSSPSFGSQHGRSCATAPAKRVRSAGRAPGPGGLRVRPRSASGRLHFHFACESRTTRRLALMLDSLVRVSRRVGRVADVTTDPERVDGARPKRQPAEHTHCEQCERTTSQPNVRGRTEARGILPRSIAGPHRPRAVTLSPKREPPSHGDLDRRQTGRGPRRSLVRWGGARTGPDAAPERPRTETGAPPHPTESEPAT